MPQGVPQQAPYGKTGVSPTDWIRGHHVTPVFPSGGLGGPGEETDSPTLQTECGGRERRLGELRLAVYDGASHPYP